MNTCTHNELENKVAILVSKKRCVFINNGIALRKGAKKQGAIIKIKGAVIPNEINTKIYQVLFVDSKSVEHIPFYS